MGYGKDTYENFATAYRVLWTLTLDPLIGFRDEVFTGWLRRRELLAGDERIETNRSKVPELPEDLEKKVERYSKLVNSGVPPNTAAEIVGLPIPELAGGDVGYMPLSLVPRTALDEGDLEEEDEDEEDVEEFERSLLNIPTKEWHYGGGAPELGSDDYKELLKNRKRSVQPYIDQMQRELKKFFQGQQNRVSRRLRDSRELGRGKFKQGEEELLPTLEELFILIEEIALFEEEFGPIITAALTAIGEEEIDLLGIDLVFDLASPEVQGAISGILETVAEKTQNRIWTDLIVIFEEAELAGEGIVAMQERLAAFYGETKSAWQTERIARTTMTGAANAGRQEAWDQSGIKERDWVSALLAGRTREGHERAHGQRRRTREAFLVGVIGDGDEELLQYPGDPAGSPANIINCLCDTVPVVGDIPELGIVGRNDRTVRQPERLQSINANVSTVNNTEGEDDDMTKVEIHNHYPKYPDELIADIVRGLPTPEIKVEAPEIPEIKVEPKIEVHPPEVKVEPKITVEAPQVTVEPQITIEAPEKEDDGTEIHVVERDGAGRIRKIRRSKKEGE
jgi:hypothetical protein